MAKIKFNLSVAPTFKATVLIPVPGLAAQPVEFIFKGRARDEFKEFLAGLSEREDIDVLLDICSGWELEDAFDRASLTKLNQNYLGASRAIIEKYLSELTAARLGN